MQSSSNFTELYVAEDSSFVVWIYLHVYSFLWSLFSQYEFPCPVSYFDLCNKVRGKRVK